MPYVNCPECGIRSFALASWSAVDRCPTCEAPLEVRRQTASQNPQARPLQGGSHLMPERPGGARCTR